MGNSWLHLVKSCGRGVQRQTTYNIYDMLITWVRKHVTSIQVFSIPKPTFVTCEGCGQSGWRSLYRLGLHERLWLMEGHVADSPETSGVTPQVELCVPFRSAS